MWDIARGLDLEIGFAHADARCLDEHGFARSDAAQAVFFAQVASKREKPFETLFFCGRIDLIATRCRRRAFAHRVAKGMDLRESRLFREQERLFELCIGLTRESTDNVGRKSERGKRTVEILAKLEIELRTIRAVHLLEHLV